MEVLVLSYIFLKKGMTHSGFVVPIFEGGDLCDIDGKTHAFHFRLVLPSETSKRVTNTYFTIIIRSFNL